tara:strand:- start:74 stop:454 length:381 start_codon:yes stop_codon:yes gene_type:complete
MFSYFYSFFYNDEKNDFEKETILSPKSREKNKFLELIRNLEKQNKKTGVNIEKCKSSKKNKNQLKLIMSALTDLFMQSKFMLKQISKLKDKNIDQENQIYIQEMLTNITELNNIFDTVYGRVKYNK